MHNINLRDEETEFDIQHGRVRLQLDFSRLNESLAKISKEVRLVPKNKQLALRLAATVINAAYDQDLIPFKEQYKIKLPKKKKTDVVNKKGNIVVNRKGEIVKKSSAKQYYSLKEVRMRQATKEIKTVTKTADTRKKETFTEEHYYPDKYTYRVEKNHAIVKNKKGKLKAVKRIAYNKEIVTYGVPLDLNKLRGVKLTSFTVEPAHTETKRRTVTTGSAPKWQVKRSIVPDPNRYITREAVHWKEAGRYIGNDMPAGLVSMLSKYNEAFVTQVKTDKLGRQREVPMMDRPPHLKDVDVTHKFMTKQRASGLVAQIRLSAKKNYDERFYEKGGVQYAYTQYYGIDHKGNTTGDAKWKRETPETTSRWLEVALGIPVNIPVKVKRGPNAKAQYAKLRSLVQEAVYTKIGVK